MIPSTSLMWPTTASKPASTSEFTATRSFRRGRAGEDRVRGELRRRGFYTIATADFSGRDGRTYPALEGRVRLPVPDILACRAGRALWVEVKTYTTPITKDGELVHGIDRHSADAYRDVEMESGLPVWLVVLEGDGSLIAGRLALLEVGAFEGAINRAGRLAPQVFYRRAAFGSLEDVR